MPPSEQKMIWEQKVVCHFGSKHKPQISRENELPLDGKILAERPDPEANDVED